MAHGYESVDGQAPGLSTRLSVLVPKVFYLGSAYPALYRARRHGLPTFPACSAPVHTTFSKGALLRHEVVVTVQGDSTGRLAGTGGYRLMILSRPREGSRLGYQSTC